MVQPKVVFIVGVDRSLFSITKKEYSFSPRLSYVVDWCFTVFFKI